MSMFKTTPKSPTLDELIDALHELRDREYLADPDIGSRTVLVSGQPSIDGDSLRYTLAIDRTYTLPEAEQRPNTRLYRTIDGTTIERV